MADGGGGAAAGETKEKEIYTYEAPWPVFSLAWSARQGKQNEFRLAVGSFVEEYANKVHIVQRDEEKNEMVLRGQFDHPYPTTKIMWMPASGSAAGKRDLLATTGDYLRLWAVSESGAVTAQGTLNNNKSSEYCAPITAFDWNEVDTSMICTASIDTTCTIWDIETKETKTQLIAHDKEVYDVSFGTSKDTFVTVGSDGSMRMFDLRHLEHSTILYESPELKPLLRVAWNKIDPNYLATITMDSSRTIIIDMRMPAMPTFELKGHTACVDSIAWAPHSSQHICTAGDDSQVLIWDLGAVPKVVEDPILAYNADAEVNSMSWAASHQDWVSISFENKMQLLRV